MRRKRGWMNLLMFGLGLFIAYVVLVFALAKGYVHPVRKHSGEPPIGFTDLSVSGLGYDIPCWVNNVAEPKAVFVLVHGYGGSRKTWLELSSALAHKGYAVVVPAMRGQCESVQKGVTFGPGERDEVLAVAGWSRKRFSGVPVVGVGVSLGGSACWLAVGSDPSAFDAVATEGAFARLDWGSDEFLHCAFRGLAPLFVPVKWIASRELGFAPESIRPDQGAAAWKGKPALVMQGTEDEMFARRNAEELSKAAGCEFWSVPGAGHAKCYPAAPEEYVRRLEGLVELAEHVREGR